MVAVARMIEMNKDKARRYREGIEELLLAEKVGLTEHLGFVPCPFDHKPCDVPNMSCSIEMFGSFASDGKEENVWSCPRSRAKNKLRSF